MTEFVEARALLAMLENDEETVIACIESMLPGERYALSVAARNLASYAAGRYEGANLRNPSSDGQV